MASIRLKQQIPGCTGRGCRVQNSGPWDPWLPGVKNSGLLAQRGHRARTAPSAPPMTTTVHGWMDVHMHCRHVCLYRASIGTMFKLRGSTFPQPYELRCPRGRCPCLGLAGARAARLHRFRKRWGHYSIPSPVLRLPHPPQAAPGPSTCSKHQPRSKPGRTSRSAETIQRTDCAVPQVRPSHGRMAAHQGGSPPAVERSNTKRQPRTDKRESRHGLGGHAAGIHAAPPLPVGRRQTTIARPPCDQCL